MLWLPVEDNPFGAEVQEEGQHHTSIWYASNEERSRLLNPSRYSSKRSCCLLLIFSPSAMARFRASLYKWEYRFSGWCVLFFFYIILILFNKDTVYNTRLVLIPVNNLWPRSIEKKSKEFCFLGGRAVCVWERRWRIYFGMKTLGMSNTIS